MMYTARVRRTLQDLRGIDHLLTRFNPNVEPDDLDILVRHRDFENCVQMLKDRGYTTSSHEHALGGRLPGFQVNLTKPERVKIDLHKDFTWRRKYYLDVNNFWKHKNDPFLVMINAIFEKTYFTREDFQIFYPGWSAIQSNRDQALKYNWVRTFDHFLTAFHKPVKFPYLLPWSVVAWSFVEKFDLITFMYTLFFRVRYYMYGILPYDDKIE